MIVFLSNVVLHYFVLCPRPTYGTNELAAEW